MKLLLDENLPKRLKQDFPEHEVRTVRELGWQGKKNGELIKLMNENGFHVLLSFDKNIAHQQNFAKYNSSVFILSAKDNSYASLKVLVDKINAELSKPLVAGVKTIQ
jgi:predicted nuclease of predicted toxin-antitoxin system